MRYDQWPAPLKRVQKLGDRLTIWADQEGYMAGKRYPAEQIIPMLRQAEIELAAGRTTGEVVRQLGISEQTYYRWRKLCGGMQVS